MASCNRCQLNQIRKRAKQEGQQVLTRPAKNFGLGRGLDVFVTPKDLTISRGAAVPAQYFSAWFMELTERCAC